MGEGGVGVLVGCRGRSAYDGSANENSDSISSRFEFCLLDDVSEDSDDSDEGEVDSLLGVVIIDRVIVSAREREAKRP